MPIGWRLMRAYAVAESTDVRCKRDADQVGIVAAVHGIEYNFAPRLGFIHSVDRSGTVIYDFGLGRTVTDSFIAKQVQLNAAAARSPDAVAIALRFAAIKFGCILILTGSQEFQRLAVETTVRERLSIKFADPALESYRNEFAAMQHSMQGNEAARNKLLTIADLSEEDSSCEPDRLRPT